MGSEEKIEIHNASLCLLGPFAKVASNFRGHLREILLGLLFPFAEGEYLYSL